MKILIDAPSPIKNPNALDVPMAILGGILFLIKYGTNKVAPPMPTKPEIIEKTKPIKLELKLFGMGELLLRSLL
jgi:hypothetical protein